MCTFITSKGFILFLITEHEKSTKLSLRIDDNAALSKSILYTFDKIKEPHLVISNKQLQDY